MQSRLQGLVRLAFRLSCPPLCLEHQTHCKKPQRLLPSTLPNLGHLLLVLWATTNRADHHVRSVLRSRVLEFELEPASV